MDFYVVLDQVVHLLRRRGRVSYRALKRQLPWMMSCSQTSRLNFVMRTIRSRRIMSRTWSGLERRRHHRRAAHRAAADAGARSDRHRREGKRRGIAWLKTMGCPHLLHTREYYVALGLERQA